MPLNELKNILEKQAVRPNKLLGQIFLRDRNVLNKIIAAANLTARDRVLEVGPGLGVLTKELAKHAGRVIAVEKDKTLAELLTKQLAEEKIDNVEVVKDDVLSFLPRICHSREGGNPVRGKLQQESRAWIPGQALDDNPLSLTSYKVVANIPYYLTSHLIRLLLESANPPSDIILMIQKQVAQRICACPPEMSLLAVSVQFYAEPKIIALVAKKSFWPQPKVDSAIIRITPRPVASEASFTGPRPLLFPERSPHKSGDVVEGSVNSLQRAPLREACSGNKNLDIKNFFTVLHAGFAQPRKQLINNLSHGLNLKREKIADILQTAGLKPEQRAETLKVEDWIKITKLFC